MLKSKKHQVVVITGASAGVGRATALEFARHGAHIGLIARGIEGLEGAKREVEELGGKAHIVEADVSDSKAVFDAADEIENVLGPIDIWVNNAMATIFSPFHEIEPEEFKRVTEVTYLGYVYGTMAALKKMIPRDHGKIVQVGSALAYRSIPLQSPYCGAKHAIVGFTESINCELIHEKRNISVSMVHLPGVNTPQFEWIRNKMPRRTKPVGAIYEPEVPARAIYWASQNKCRQLLVGYPTYQAVWGEKFIPGLLDHYMAKIVYKGHMTKVPEDPNRPDDLWTAVPGDFGAHGPFDDKAISSSPLLWMSMHKKTLLTLGLLAAPLGFFLLRNRNKAKAWVSKSLHRLEPQAFIH